MGDVVEMKRKVSAQVTRFGHVFRVEYQIGPNCEISDSAAALYVDDTFSVWLSVDFDEADQNVAMLDIDDADHIVEPSMVGICPMTESSIDLQYLVESDEYMLTELTLALRAAIEARALVSGPCPAPSNIHPWERGRSVAALWCDHGQVIEKLPDLIAIEIKDAVEAMGLAMAEAVDSTHEVNRDECGNLLRNMIEDALEQWESEGHD